MVEGPGCALYGEKLQARVRRGQAVRSARGSALAAAAGVGLETADTSENRRISD
uniref:Uncharacterized protein n=1 Tax=Amazona collaria TaxID=241587 RepID=A0A8B9GBB3_9PSIT